MKIDGWTPRESPPQQRRSIIRPAVAHEQVRGVVHQAVVAIVFEDEQAVFDPFDRFVRAAVLLAKLREIEIPAGVRQVPFADIYPRLQVAAVGGEPVKHDRQLRI